MPEKETFALINACLNALATGLLVSAWVMIRRRNVRAHATLMISALATSAVFLVFYLTSHYLYGSRSTGLGLSTLAVIYFVILVPHVLLAMFMLPLIAMTLWRAIRGDYARHRTLARPTLGIWVYVSVTGVLVYFMLYHVIPAMTPAPPA
jgi:uncharacterized membrane protein YozB (DUF420 family)